MALLGAPEATATSYSINFQSADDFLALIDAEDCFRVPCLPSEHMLLRKLEQLNLSAASAVSNIEYDLMFGSHICFTLNAEADTPENMLTIVSLIEQHVLICRKVAAEQTAALLE